jgi:hypothetical protein
LLISSSGLAKRSRYIDDMTTNRVFHISFVPNTGNKYFLAAGDETVKLYDFEEETVRPSACKRKASKRSGSF